MSNHTPGPWFGMLVETDKADHFHISSPTGEICDLPMRKHSTLPPSLEKSRVESDARLIASAPELLAVLKQEEMYMRAGIAAMVPGYRGLIDRLIKIQATIAKAEGRE